MLTAVAAPGPSADITLPPPAPGPVDFDRDIAPLFERHCVSCHGPERQRGGLRLDVRTRALAGGNSGPAIVPGRSAESPLLHFVIGEPADMRMPREGEPLSNGEVGLLRAWIEQGAPWPQSQSDAGEADPARTHWAFQPLMRPAVPVAASAAEPLQPVDAFIDARLAAEGLRRNPEADPRSLIRRLYLVMLGVPPGPGEVEAFVNDTASDAYERLVDRVLGDMRYGERWARHWLDVIRFAESNGFETNRERLQAWRFRDYVIQSFNEDKPYDQFVREQIAGDALGADVATGFLVGGPVDIVKSPDPRLTAQQRADELDDMVATTGTTFLGLTLGCARCHTHKFDPVTHREYHALTALLAGVQHGERPVALPPSEEAARARRLEELAAQLVVLNAELTTFEPQAVVEPGALPGRPEVQARLNVDRFAPVTARRLRFVIEETRGGGEPCLDELEVYSGARNVALASRGTTVRVSGTLPGYAIHQAAHVNDGRTGNDHSWIADTTGQGWVELAFPEAVVVDRVVWGRDREGRFGDRTPGRYRIEVADDIAADWQTVATSADRLPAGSAKGDIASLAPEAAAQRSRLLSEQEACLREQRSLRERPTTYSGTFQTPRTIRRLHRGDPLEPREAVAPGTLELFRPLQLAEEAPEQARRLALADWIAHPENPLTARVLVNRVWQHAFGVGLVATPNDFGLNGSPPSHPELLDWLAADFIASGWRLKALHRQLLLSGTWRQSSAPREDARRVDANSRLLWRFPPRRLEAEAIRDTLLAVSGVLDPTPGGPGFYLHEVDRENVYHYHPKEQFGPAEYRRMIYAFKVRMEQDGVFGAFDCPDGSLVVPKRSSSTTPLQALNLFNSRFTLDLADAFAARLDREAGGDPADRIGRAWLLAFGRAPAAGERDEALAWSAQHGFPALCRALLNANELVFLP
ncbi:MAG: PSD1 domain-containing protein [Verrucomicrobiae bacterium]|nr:PSD1 domain-containing protein [Verrucomicrobiae bacterium]